MPEFAQVTALIRSVGGISSLAHPKDRATRESLRSLQAQGLDAVEARHPSHSGPVRAQIDLAPVERQVAQGGRDVALGVVVHEDGRSAAVGELLGDHVQVGGIGQAEARVSQQRVRRAERERQQRSEPSPPVELRSARGSGQG